MMVTTIPNNTHNLTTLPHEILMLIATTPQDLCLLAQTSKVLSDVSSDDRVWKPIFLRYRKYAYNKKEHITWKTATLGVNHARFEYDAPPLISHLLPLLHYYFSTHILSSFSSPLPSLSPIPLFFPLPLPIPILPYLHLHTPFPYLTHSADLNKCLHVYGHLVPSGYATAFSEGVTLPTCVPWKRTMESCSPKL